MLEVANLTRTGRFEDVSFSVRAGEIVAFAGLVGSGRSEVVRAIFGIDRYDARPRPAARRAAAGRTIPARPSAAVSRSCPRTGGRRAC